MEVPILGKSAIGIEIANKEIPAVSIQGIVEAKDFMESLFNIVF